jgi:hypothetical protein
MSDERWERWFRFALRLPARWQHRRFEAMEAALAEAGRTRLLARMAAVRVRHHRERRLGRIRSRPAALEHFESRVHSQNGEDGVLGEIFRRVGAPGRFCVELGSGDGAENCTRRLVEAGSWRGLWVDASATATRRARAALRDRPVAIVDRLLTRGNVAPVLEEAGVPAEPDLLVIDVDGNDYWLWERIGRAFRPRVVAIEYNASFVPGIDWTMPYDPRHVWDETRRHGASLDALAVLGARLGYRLVACESAGVNAFFVRRDLAKRGLFEGAGRAREHYWPPGFADLWFGHAPMVAGGVPLMQALAPPERGSIRLAAEGPVPSSVPPGAELWIRVAIQNRSGATLATRRPFPVQLSYRWLDEPGERVVVEDGLRTKLLRPLGDGSSSAQEMRVVAPADAGGYRLRLTLVQEGWRWWDGEPTLLRSDHPIRIG